MSEILMACRSFITTKKGRTVHVYQGDLAHADHPIVAVLPEAFTPITVKFAVEQPKSKPKGKATDATVA